MTHSLAEWKDEIAWMSLYFSAAVWASLALCAFYALDNDLMRCGAERTVASCVVERGGSGGSQAHPVVFIPR